MSTSSSSVADALARWGNQSPLAADFVKYRDRAASHPVIRALAGESVGDALTPTELPSEEELDDVQPPAKTFTILDADSSQRMCLEAAARGHHFVMDGPPGRGKSQTIVNLIADFVANGKTVLVVSENDDALATVANRLRETGVGDLCFEQHGQVKEENEAFDFDKLQQRREKLAKYVQALHQPREPLQQSAWWALGELIRCAEAPAVPWSIAEGTEVLPAWLDDAKQACQRAGQLWHIGQQGQNYVWWGFKVGERFTLKLRDEIVVQVEKARKQLDRLLQVSGQVASQFGCKASVPWLLRAGELLETNPRPPAAWLTATDLPQIASDLEKGAEQFKERGQSRDPLTERYGPTLWNQPEGTANAVDQAWHCAAPLLPSGDDQGAGLLTHQQQLRGWAADTQKRIPVWLTEAKTIEKWLAVNLPRGSGAATPHDPSPHWLKRLLRLAHLCATEIAPEKAWVVDGTARTQVSAMIETNQPAFAKYHATHNQLLETYTEQFFELELDRIADGFAGPYLSWTRVFNLQFRRDRRAIARRSKGQATPASIQEDIVLARDLMKEKTRLEGEQPARKAVLGRYEKGLETDFEAAQRAVRIAEEALEIVPELGHEELPDKFVEALASAGQPPEKIRAAIKRLQDSVGAWSHATEELREFLPAEVMPGTGQPLEDTALSALMQYAADLQTALNRFATLADPVLASAKSPPPDAASLVADLREAERLRQHETVKESDNAKWVTRFGSAFQGMATDWSALRKKLTWTLRVREHFASASSEWQSKAGDGKAGSTAIPAGAAGIPPTEFLQLVASGSSAPTKDLRHAQEQLNSALHSIENRFEFHSPQSAGEKCPGEANNATRFSALSLDDLKKRLKELRDRAGELSDWFDWHHQTLRFEHLGLAEFWSTLQKAQPSREQLVDAFMKSLLIAWLERVFQQEPALGQFRREEHERALAEFRDLDRQLLRVNATRVASAASQWGKSSLSTKPCQLMDLISVSQLPGPDKTLFDLVVFDEASQIATHDAIGAILRGKQIIVSGDDSQPPADEFADAESSVGENLLQAALKGGLPRHRLRWSVSDVAQDASGPTARDLSREAPIETDVGDEVEKRGFKVEALNGIGLAVIDPEHTEQPLLGIEFDGPDYHAIPTVRDRERLRPEMLANRGWRLHRIWAMAWFRNKQLEVERLREALATAKQVAAQAPVTAQGQLRPDKAETPTTALAESKLAVPIH